ncbi:MAG: PAS domain S-box protein [Bdellovibrionales bacterium]|jgi:PAS domain S-box-containing protein|nr:PAS domain S-box protein [Bdellovibrionales bacterium]MBT3526323.1 PAS domain S-box protein [Bdellovibrionales bacterium]MBT7670667.1 PAS domain S-box protein [Bdellovibrionales bacterium]
MFKVFKDKRVTLLLLIMLVVSISIGLISIGTLYQTSMQQQRARLIEVVTSQARLIEAIARHDSQAAVKHPQRAAEATLSQIRSAHKNYDGFGQTGEFTLSKRKDQEIVFLLNHRHFDLDKPQPVKWNSNRAEPARRALRGESGTVIAMDYRGVQVLAAYEPVSVLNLGVVAKIDLTEIRRPFYNAIISVALVGMLLISVGVFFFARISRKVLTQIEEKNELLNAVLMSTGEAIYGIDIRGCCTLANNSCLKVLGYNYEQDLAGKNMHRLIHHSNEDRSLSPHKDCRVFETITTGMRTTSADNEFFWRANGTSFPVEYRSHPVIQNGVIVGAVVSFCDISDRVAADNDKKNTIKRHQMLWELNQSSPDLTEQELCEQAVEVTKAITDSECGYTHMIDSDPTKEALELGIWTDSILTQETVIHNNYHNGIFENIKRHISVPIMDNGEINFILGVMNKKNSYNDLDVHQVQMVANEMQKIFLRHRAEERLLQSERNFQTITEHLPDIIFRYDLEGRHLFASPNVIKVFGRKASEYIGKDHTELGDPPELAIYWQEKIQDTIRTGEIQDDDYYYESTDGSKYFYLNSCLSPEYGEDGLIQSVIGVTRDITVRKGLEEALKHSQQRSDSANEAKSSFLAHMSHEIRTPLNAILGVSDILLEEAQLDSEQRRFLRISQKAGGALLALVNDILDLSKIEAGQFNLRNSVFVLPRLVMDTIEIPRELAKEKGIDLKFESNLQDDYRVEGDPDRLQQVLLNLTTNAVKFTFEGKVVVSIDKVEGKNVILTVSDTGVGIPAGKLESIFSPFSQIDSEHTRQVKGTGLGLTICSRLVQAMGGEVTVDSAPGVGSRFRVAIPLQQSNKDLTYPERSTSQRLPTNAKRSSPDKLGLNILLVDDSEDNRTLINAYLKRTPHKITFAENGQIAYELAKTKPVDLIFMDMLMPVLDGYDATRKIREWERETGRSAVPIIALTAQARKEDLNKTLEVGCSSCLTKPVKKDTLLQTIASH